MTANLRGYPLSKLRLDLFSTVKKALDRAVLIGLFIKTVENSLDGPQHDMQRNASVLPALDQRPVERAKQQMLAPPSYKRILDLGEVIVVVQCLAGVRL